SATSETDTRFRRTSTRPLRGIARGPASVRRIRRGIIVLDRRLRGEICAALWLEAKQRRRVCSVGHLVRFQSKGLTPVRHCQESCQVQQIFARSIVVSSTHLEAAFIPNTALDGVLAE